MQAEMGSRTANQRMTAFGPANDRLGADERAFISLRDGFYLATVGESGWPYIQFRGGPPGFLSIRDDQTLAFADITGNRQYITTGNLRANSRVALFLMDYPNRSRLKILADASLTRWSEAPEWKRELLVPDRGRPERLVTFHLAAFDWNCPQNIPQRWTLEELQQTPIFERLRSLEQENAQLRARLHDQAPTRS